MRAVVVKKLFFGHSEDICAHHWCFTGTYWSS